MNLLKDLGFTYRSVSGAELTGGYLRQSGARVLFLPYMVAMSSQEADAIRQWVEQGGCVIADLAPAVMDEHCRQLGKGQLDDLFGIDRAHAAIVAGKPSADGKTEPWLTRPLSADGVETLCAAPLVETGLQASAEAIWRARRDAQDEPTPIVFRRRAGKGAAWYLGYHAFGSYAAMKSAVLRSPDALPALTQFKGLFESMLGEAGVKAHTVIRLRDPQTGQPGVAAPYVTVFNKQSGSLRYVTAMRDFYVMGFAADDFPARVCFDHPAHIHEMRTGTYLGHGQSVDLTMTEYTMRLYALLPYRVESIKLVAEAGQVRAGEDGRIAAAAVVAGGEPERHWLRVDVFGPDRAPVRAYSGNVAAPGGKTTLVIPFAVNDPVGTWRVHVRDVASGVRADCSIQLQAR